MRKLSQFKQSARQLDLDEVLTEIEAEEVNNIIIIGGTREAACERLKEEVPNDGIVHREWYDEVTTDNAYYMAFGGGPDDADNICWLRALGARRIAEIHLVGDGISEEMHRYANYVSSANER